MSEWKPIESAPRDGTEFLAYWFNSKTYGICHMAKDGEWSDECDHSTSAPTHWMELPEPPQ